MTTRSDAPSADGEATYQERRVPAVGGELYVREYPGLADVAVAGSEMVASLRAGLDL
jgi:hypothetical protein